MKWLHYLFFLFVWEIVYMFPSQTGSQSLYSWKTGIISSSVNYWRSWPWSGHTAADFQAPIQHLLAGELSFCSLLRFSQKNILGECWVFKCATYEFWYEPGTNWARNSRLARDEALMRPIFLIKRVRWIGGNGRGDRAQRVTPSRERATK